ncbi:hypothetical protein [Streptomyces sp. x-80]|uniref:hypothetical protein n=1 Tax=Streptomyces sp. x-80 TaxID=2789282 RepID=UPI00397ED9AD
MALADRTLTLRRDVHSEEVLARGGDPEAHSILQRTGFVPVVRYHETYHRLPTGLDAAEEKRLATRVVARLRAVRYHVGCDDAFATGLREPHYIPLGTRVAYLAERIREAESTEDVADALTELTAAHDGILTAFADVLTATSGFYQDLGRKADPHIAERLRYLAAEALGVITSDLRHTRNELADRHEAHPRRTTCSGEVPPREREASAVCACPPPPSLRRRPDAGAELPCTEETMPALRDNRDLESFAAALADELPGQWHSQYRRHTEYRDQFALVEDVWDMNMVAHAIVDGVLEHDAVLTRDDGARLYVIGRPRHDNEFLVGAMAPGFAPEAFRGVREPDGIAVPDDPYCAADDITVDLLPRYDKAVAKVQHNATHPTPPAPAPAPAPEHVVLTWFGDGLLAATTKSPEAAKALHDNGFTWDPREMAFVLSGDDTTHQAHCVQEAGAQLARHGIGVITRHPPTRSALETTTPPAPPHLKPASHSR